MPVVDNTSTPIHQLHYITRNSFYAASAQQSTRSRQHCIGYRFERSQRVVCQSSLSTLQSAFCWLRSVPDGLQRLVMLASQPGLW